MKIGIFGCSAAVDHYAYFPGTDIFYHSWSHLVKDHYPETENFAVGGSSLFFSYTNWLNNRHKNYDKTIFIVTNPERWYMPNLPLEFQHASGVGHLEVLRDRAKDLETRKILQTVIDYEIYAKDSLFYKTMHNFMVNEILQFRGPDFLILPLNETCIANWTGEFMKPIFWLDIDHYQIDDWGHKDQRKCHMNRENNRILADKIIKWTQTGKIDLNINDFTTSKWPVEYYFYKE